MSERFMFVFGVMILPILCFFGVIRGEDSSLNDFDLVTSLTCSFLYLFNMMLFVVANSLPMFVVAGLVVSITVCFFVSAWAAIANTAISLFVLYWSWIYCANEAADKKMSYNFSAACAGYLIMHSGFVEYLKFKNDEV